MTHICVCHFSWPELAEGFQTYEDGEKSKNINHDIQSIRHFEDDLYPSLGWKHPHDVANPAASWGLNFFVPI